MYFSGLMGFQSVFQWMIWRQANIAKLQLLICHLRFSFEYKIIALYIVVSFSFVAFTAFESYYNENNAMNLHHFVIEYEYMCLTA